MSKPAFDFSLYEGFDQKLELDTLESRRKRYILVDANGTHVNLTATAYGLLLAIRSGATFESLADSINQRGGRRVTEAQLQTSYQQLTEKLLKIAAQKNTQRLPWGFWARVRLLPPRLVRKMASGLQFLYSPWPACVLCLLIFTAIGYCWMTSLLLDYSGSAFLYGYLLFLGSMLIHEFGHAAACSKYGAKPSEIGFAMYLIYPALYSDVTTAWRLGRWKRVAVDLGGCYFQFLLGIIFLSIFQFTGWAPLRIAFLLIVYASLFSLNPIFRFDGYWVLADVLGVTNLARQPRRIASHAMAWVRGKDVQALPWPGPVLAILVIYSFASIIVWCSFIWKLIPLLHERLLEFAAQCRGLAGHFAVSTWPKWPEIKAVLISIYVLAILGIMMWQLLKTFYKFAMREGGRLWKRFKPANVQKTSPRPATAPAGHLGMNNARNSFPMISHVNDGE